MIKYFNTTLVSVRPGIFASFGLGKTNFNTTLVSVRLVNGKCVDNCSKFQYNTCFGSTCFKTNEKIICIWISIQHLFRFDKSANVKPLQYYGFQYNTCFGSTVSVKMYWPFMWWFQYNTCFGSTQLILEAGGYVVRFQYNTCFGSTLQPYFKIIYEKWFQYNTCFGSTKI